jgi:hypothetical protein
MRCNNPFFGRVITVPQPNGAAGFSISPSGSPNHPRSDMATAKYKSSDFHRFYAVETEDVNER